MVGVGTIFEDYAKAAIEDDDEIVRIHSGAAKNYKPSSEAMVNIRHTLAKAVEQRIICRAAADRLAQIAKGLFYPHRQYHKISDEGLRQGLSAAELQRFQEWIPAGRVDQQMQDAIAMLARMRKDLAAHPGPKRLNFSFEYTKYWDRVERAARSRRANTPKRARTTASRNK